MTQASHGGSTSELASKLMIAWVLANSGWPVEYGSNPGYLGQIFVMLAVIDWWYGGVILYNCSTITRHPQKTQRLHLHNMFCYLLKRSEPYLSVSLRCAYIRGFLLSRGQQWIGRMWNLYVDRREGPAGHLFHLYHHSLQIHHTCTIISHHTQQIAYIFLFFEDGSLF